MTAPQLRVKIEYCEKMQEKHENLGKHFETRVVDLKEDLQRMLYLDFSN